MAGNPLHSEGMDNFNKDLEANIKRIERLSKAADKASDSIDKLSETYDKLANLAEEPIDLKIRNRGSRNSSSGKSGNNNSSGNNKNKKKNDLFFTITRLSDTATSASNPISSLAGNVTKLGIATGGTIAAISLLSKVTVEAQKNTYNYARSLTVMGNNLTLLDKRSIETSNQINKLNNRMNNMLQGIGDVLSPVLDFVVDLAEVATSFIPDSERKDKIAGIKADIVSNAQQSGYTKSSGNVLANGTYNDALSIADKYGEQASVVADKLAKAWQTGSDAAKDYGVVLNDNVLTGYLATKGIDIANVQITDAMKQYYRYQLMIEQTSGNVTDTMIKDWTSLGFMIDKTKGKLFSFDEVIQLTATDSTIPELTGSIDDVDVKDDPTVAGGTVDNNLNNTVDNLNNTVDNLNNTVLGIESASDNLNSAAERLEIAENNNTNTLLALGDSLNAPANNMLIASNNMLLAADSMNNISEIIIIAFNSIYAQMLGIADIMSSTIDASVNNAANVLNSVTQNGVILIGEATNNGIMALTNATSYMNSSLMNTTSTGLMNIQSATTNGLAVINSATNKGLNSINSATNNAVDAIIDVSYREISSVNSTGNSWVNTLNNVGKQIIASITSSIASYASTWGLGQHINIGKNIVNDVKNNVSNSTTTSGKVGGTAKGVVTGTAKGAKANASALINNPVDLITEGADLITSLKNDKTGKYEWEEIPSAVANMAVSSITNPIKAISSGAKYGYNASKENTGSTLLGGLGGATGAFTNMLAYGGLEFTGDLVNLAELAQDGVVGAWNGITGSNVSSTDTGLSKFSNNIDVLLNDLVNGTSNSGLWDWMSTPAFADGGIGTHEIHGATLFENNKREAVIPLETNEGIDYLANAMSKAGAGDNNGSSGDIVINLTLSGLNLADNDAEWERVGRKIGEVIDIQRQRRGELNYGSIF